MVGRISWRGIALSGAAVVAITVAASVPLGAATAGAKVQGQNGQILFLRWDPTVGDFTLFTVNPDGTHLHALLPGTAVECAKWSPDGTRISTCGNPLGGATRIINPDTNTFVDVPQPDPAIFSPCLVWSPDGNTLACESSGQTDASLNGIYTMPSGGGPLTRITTNPGGDDLPFDYSPDGQQIVFSRINATLPKNANVALFVVNTDGSGLRQLTPWGFPDQDDGGSWSPDGKWILFDCNPADTNRNSATGSLCVVHPDGSGLNQIPLAVSGYRRAHDPSWSPDGTKIVFNLFTHTSPGTGQEGIYTANADGSDVRLVTSSPTSDNFPDWGTHPLAGP
jgi:Tol biopolymer transport system component